MNLIRKSCQPQNPRKAVSDNWYNPPCSLDDRWFSGRCVTSSVYPAQVTHKLQWPSPQTPMALKKCKKNLKYAFHMRFINAFIDNS